MNSILFLLYFLALVVIFWLFLAPLCGPKSSKGPQMDFDPQVYYFTVTLGKK